MNKLRIPEASRYSSHAGRRGTTQEIKESGPTCSVVATTGLWHSPDFRGYQYMSRYSEIGARQLGDVDLDSESDA